MSLKLLPDIPELVEDLGLPGIVAFALLPVLFPVVGKPLAKAIIKGGILLYENSKGAIAPVRETWKDIITQAKTELATVEEKPLKSAEAPTEIATGQT
jgi:Protein of unknown function (DUF5132)